MHVDDIKNWSDEDLDRVEKWIMSKWPGRGPVRPNTNAFNLVSHVQNEQRIRALLNSNNYLGRVLAGARPIT